MIYLDNAATTYPKPASVLQAVTSCMRLAGGNPGRGSHKLSLRAAEIIYDCREEVSDLLGSSHPERLIFTLNATMAINLLIKGVLREGDHVLISDMEHNAVLRPLHKMTEAGIISYSIFPTHVSRKDAANADILAGIWERIRPNTRLLLCAHVSNVAAKPLPLQEIGALCHEKNILFGVDASQSAGHLPIQMEKMGIDALCIPGHKGLYGPQGTGCLLLGNDLTLETLTEGGSGYHSLDPAMPTEPPERYEAGTLPTPAIAGLLEGVREVKRRGVGNIGAHLAAVNGRLQSHMSAIDGITVHAPHASGATLLFSHSKIPSDTLASALDSRGFCVRAGYHCAPLAHKTLSTPKGGAIRVSPSMYTTEQEIDLFFEAVKEACKE